MLKEPQNCNLKLFLYLSQKQAKTATVPNKYTFSDIKINISMQKTKFASYKHYLLGPKITGRHCFS